MIDLSHCAGDGSLMPEARYEYATTLSGIAPDVEPAKPTIGPRWMPWIFAAKTTASALLALLVAYTFNLDEPRWSVLCIYIVAQPQSGLVLAKSFYRIIGTVVGATASLILVALFAQERVLFLGALAIWIGLCTFASRYARNFASYGFVLSGYTAAIVGVPGALEPGNAFYIAQARVTEISLGIMSAALISHLVLPNSLAAALRSAVAAARTQLLEYATALLFGADASSAKTLLLGQAVTIENMRASAVFEDPDIRGRSDALRRLEIAFLDFLGVSQLLGRSLEWFRRSGAAIDDGLDEATLTARAAIDLWRAGVFDATDLALRLDHVNANLPPVLPLDQAPSASDEEVMRHAGAVARMQEFCFAFTTLREAYDAYLAPQPPQARHSRFPVANDTASAVWAGLRAALALAIVSTFWILTNWLAGATAAVLAPLVTARLATMEHPVQTALGGSIVVTLAAIPGFIVVEVLLPLASGFPMFVLAAAPMLFFCSYLMASPRTFGLGFLAGLEFAYIANFQDRMAYDPIALINTSIAVSLACASAFLLFAVVAPDTPRTARRRFVRFVRKTFDRIARKDIGLTEFETTMTEALDQLRRGLEHHQAESITASEAGVALLGAGRELIRLRDAEPPVPLALDIARDVARFLAGDGRVALDHALRSAQDAAVTCLAVLRDAKPGVAEARIAVREMVAFAAIQDELEHGSAFVEANTMKGASNHAD